MSEPVRIVCFDLGGVIVRICRSWEEGCRQAGLPVRDGTDAEEHRARRRAVSEQYHVGRITCDEFCERVAETTGGAYSPEEIRTIHDAWLIEEYPGIAGVVDRLLGMDRIETGVLSNTNHAHWEHQLVSGDRFPTPGRPRHLIASHIVRAAKPDEAIYRAFERASGVTGPSILFFDDLEENVAAARAIGWRAEQIDHAGDTAAQIEHHLKTHGV